jgi:hypothetical protein
MDKKPTLLLVKSTVWTCSRCGYWMQRQPAYWRGEFGKGEQCPKCGCTSVKGRPGRSFGPRSKMWEMLCDEWDNYWEEILKFDPQTVLVK